MGLSLDTAQAIRTEAEELARLSRAADHPADLEVTKFVRTLLAFIMRADGGFSGEELAVLAAYNRDGFSWHEEIEYARETVLDAPRFLRTVPSFVLAGIAHDQLYGSTVSRQMVTTVSRLCDIIATADGVAQADELENAAVLLSTLRSSLDFRP
jgi:tellurite resistance protein